MHRRAISTAILALTALIGLAAAGPAFAQEQISILFDPLGPIAELQRLELIWASMIVLVAVLPVFIGVSWIVFYYRRSNEKSGIVQTGIGVTGWKPRCGQFPPSSS